MTRARRHGAACLACALILALPGPATAALDQASALPLVSVTPAYRVHEAVLDNGSVIREYASTQQRVFAVRWRGPVLPDLRVWLGVHHPAYVRAAEAARATGLRGGPLVFASEDLVLRSTGRMREFQGHAYLPAQVPAGVDIGALLR
ncbi:MAG: DUF2844 domain-containing protein [Rhodoferax sp.]|nr:DUF2844 domain-containing protein [Rhodoferax sp.]